MKKHFNIRVSGLVQGVFFRASAKEAAETIGVTGFVRNEPDGSVYAEAEGEQESLMKFVAWCRRGPSRARVEECDVQEGVMKNFQRFTIDR